jgi:hypothetical protein
MLLLGASLTIGMASPLWAQNGTQTDVDGGVHRSPATAPAQASPKAPMQRNAPMTAPRAAAPGTVGQGASQGHHQTEPPNKPVRSQNDDVDVVAPK